MPEIPVCHVESSESNGKGVKSPKAKATGKSPRAAVKSPKVKATRKSLRATVKSPKAKTAQTAKPVCQAKCTLLVSPLLQGILHVLYVPLIKPLIAVVAASPTHILYQLNHRALWKVQWRIHCGNSRRATAMNGCLLFLLQGDRAHFLLGEL